MKGSATPLDIQGLALTIYIQNREVFVDVTIYGDEENPLIQIHQDDITVTPPNWDKNYDATAVEVVNEKGEPVFQLIGDGWFHIILNGTFPYSGGMIYANKNGMSFTKPNNFHLDPIFKYPSSEYLGIRR
jgi:hypothetical protein